MVKLIKITVPFFNSPCNYTPWNENSQFDPLKLDWSHDLLWRKDAVELIPGWYWDYISRGQDCLRILPCCHGNKPELPCWMMRNRESNLSWDHPLPATQPLWSCRHMCESRWDYPRPSQARWTTLLTHKFITIINIWLFCHEIQGLFVTQNKLTDIIAYLFKLFLGFHSIPLSFPVLVFSKLPISPLPLLWLLITQSTLTSTSPVIAHKSLSLATSIQKWVSHKKGQNVKCY